MLKQYFALISPANYKRILGTEICTECITGEGNLEYAIKEASEYHHKDGVFACCICGE